MFAALQLYRGSVARDWMLEITANSKRSSFFARFSELGIQYVVGNKAIEV